MPTPATLVELLERRAVDAPNQGYRYLRDLAVVDSTTYAQLAQSARGIATAMVGAGVRVGDPVLLLFVPGLDFVKALFGCFCAGAAAVPAYPPNPGRIKRSLARLRSVVQSCSPRVVLGSPEICSAAAAIIEHIPELADARWINVAALDTEFGDWRGPVVAPTDLAIIQYTSGSTGEPKGVLITHDNVLHNQRLIGQAFQSRPSEDVVVSWLPVYHDMGLIGSTIHPAFLGSDCVMMAPLEFLQSPFKWLSAISSYGGTVAGAPNFAFELCTQKVSDEQLASLDLSRWRLAYCGAEPINIGTLERFAARFAACGFRRSAFLPCYGLAEATLIVSGAWRSQGFVSSQVDVDGYRNEQLIASAEGGQSLVGSGPVVGDQEVLIVADGMRRSQGEVGEIWVRGGSVGQGYFGLPERSKETFGATLADGSGPFLRTGDLGAFGADDELYVVGRIKDLLIIRGLNYYPSDIEQSLEATVPNIRKGSSVAFTLDDTGDGLAVLFEYDARASRENVDWDALVTNAISAVGSDHDLAVRSVMVAVAGEVPKTSSGKIRRSETRRRALADELKLHYRWDAQLAVTAEEPEAGRSAEEIAEFIAEWLSRALGRAIEHDALFEEIGLDSLESVLLTDALGAEMDRELSPTLAFDYPTIRLLAAHLAGTLGKECETAKTS